MNTKETNRIKLKMNPPKKLPAYRSGRQATCLPVRQASYKLHRGFILVEAMVALSALTLAMLGIFTVLSSSLGFNQTLVNKHIAASLAGEGIELVKNIIDKNYGDNQSWNTGLAGLDSKVDYEMGYNDSGLESNDRFIKYSSSTRFYGYSSGDATPFKRKININNISASKIEVTSTVTWKDRNNIEFTVVVVGRFYDWRK